MVIILEMKQRTCGKILRWTFHLENRGKDLLDYYRPPFLIQGKKFKFAFSVERLVMMGIRSTRSTYGKWYPMLLVALK